MSAEFEPSNDPEGMALEFLDVGQGDGTLIQFPPWNLGGPMGLVDFGKKSTSFVPVYDALDFLIARITEVCNARNPVPQQPTLDYLFITHPDGDHWNALGMLIKGEKVWSVAPTTTGLWQKAGWPKDAKLVIGKLIYGGTWATYRKKNATLADLITSQSKVTEEAFPRGFQSPTDKPYATIGGVQIFILSANLGNGKDANPDSLVLMLSYKITNDFSRKVILPGDADSKIVENAIIAKYEPAFLKCDILKLGHHGSKASSSEDFLRALRPYVVTATGDRRWGHPYWQAIDRAMPYVQDLPKIQPDPLAPPKLEKDRYCCSGGLASYYTNLIDAIDYNNRETEKGVCTNLWYVVKYPYETLTGPKGKETGYYGWYGGVQWRIQINVDGSIAASHTDQWPNPS